MNIYHVFSCWRSGCTGPRKSTYDTRPSMELAQRVWSGTRLLVRLCSFGSLVLQISLRLPSDFLYRSNCHVEKQSVVGSLVFAQLFIASKSCRGERFTHITLEYTLKLKIQSNQRQENTTLCLHSNFQRLVFSASREISGSELHTHTQNTTTVCLQGSAHRGIMSKCCHATDFERHTTLKNIERRRNNGRSVIQQISLGSPW